LIRTKRQLTGLKEQAFAAHQQQFIYLQRLPDVHLKKIEDLKPLYS
jgi:hypothetical protein